MKLYYDMFIPYMPDKDVDEEGKLVPSKTREAGRNAMIELSNFQRTGNLISLYNAVLNACIYAEVDLIDEILGLPEDLEIPDISITEAVDMCAKMLFKSINPENKFDINKFVAILLTAAHFGVESINAEQAAKDKEAEKDTTPDTTAMPETPVEPNTDKPEDVSQISMAEVMGIKDEKM